MVEADVSTDQTDICSAGNGLEDRQRITKANERLGCLARLSLLTQCSEGLDSR